MHIEPTTPTIARLHRARRAASVTVAAVACAVLASACGSSSSSSSTATTPVNTTQVALSIEQSIFTKRHIHAKVVCPAAVPQETGGTFECIATSKATKPPFAEARTPFVVTIQNNKGYVTYAGK
jgi:hypothetical protein